MSLFWLLGGAIALLAIGVLLGRFYTPDREPLRRAAQEGRAHIHSLTRMLEGDTEGAVEALVETLKGSGPAMDSYFALGALFRQQGEYERAVRVHQTLLVRRGLDQATRLRVHVQLALDFKAAGFVKRGIKALEWVVAQDPRDVRALGELGALLEQAGQWERAAAVYRRLGKLGDDTTMGRVGRLHAEAAREALTLGDTKAAHRFLRRATAAAPDSAQVLFATGEYHQQRGHPKQAIKAWGRAVEQSPRLAGYALELMSQLLPAGSVDAELEQWLDVWSRGHEGDVHLRLERVRLALRRGSTGAVAQLRELIHDVPSLLAGRRELVGWAVDHGDDQVLRESVRDLLRLLESADRGYRCRACGYAADGIFWRCPGCGVWESVGLAWGRRVTDASLAGGAPPRARDGRPARDARRRS